MKFNRWPADMQLAGRAHFVAEQRKLFGEESQILGPVKTVPTEFLPTELRP